MTEQYQQNSINEFQNYSSLEIQSYDFRQTEGLVPAGTTASIQGLRIPGPVQLKRLAYCGVLGPGAGESVELRLFRIRPASNPAGFGFIQLNDTVTINQANFADAGNEFDFSNTIREDLCVFPGEYLACSWVHVVGAGVMQPLNMNWSFTTLGASEPYEPPATTTNYANVFG